MRKSLIAFITVVVLFAEAAATVVSAAAGDTVYSDEKPAEAKVVVVIADYLNIKDLNRMKYVGSLEKASHVALMNNRQPGNARAGKSKLIIGSGKGLELNPGSVSGGSGTDSLNMHGIGSGQQPRPGNVIYTDIFKLRERNKESEYRNYIGYLGDALNAKKAAACFIGNADAEERNRSSLLVAMDSSGVVDSGDTENVLKYDTEFPYGIRTDYKKLADLYKHYLPASSFLVIETGDMERLESFSSNMSSESYEAYKSMILKDIDALVEELVDYGGFGTLVLISTFPSKIDYEKNNRLTPVIVYDEGKGGVLYSNSTRREGIVLNTDIADYILQRLGYIESSNIEVSDIEITIDYLEKMNERIVVTSSLRTPVLTAFATMVIAALVMMLAAVLPGTVCKSILLSTTACSFAYAMLAMPIAFLYIPAYYFAGSPMQYLAMAAAVSFFISLLLQYIIKDKIKIVFFICLLLFSALTVDIIWGSPFMKQSVLGYDPIIGARFYGIGNEYGGIIAGCALLLIGCLQELRKRKLHKMTAAFFFIGCIMLTGLTSLGANFGVSLAETFGFLIAYYLIYGIKFNKRNALAGIFIMGSAAAALVIADSMGIKSPSHVGRLVRSTEVNGFGVVWATINRKISMNLRLIRYTIWTKVLLCIIAIITIMFFRPVKLLEKLFKRYKYLKYSWIGTAAASIAGFGVNDSGIVVAATAMIYAAFTLLIMCVGERDGC